MSLTMYDPWLNKGSAVLLKLSRRISPSLLFLFSCFLRILIQPPLLRKWQWQNVIQYMKNDKRESRPICNTCLRQMSVFYPLLWINLRILSIINGYSKYFINNTGVFLNSKRLILAALIFVSKWLGCTCLLYLHNFKIQ